MTRGYRNALAVTATVAVTLVLAVLLVTAVIVLRHAGAAPVAEAIDLSAAQVLAGTRAPGEGLRIRLNDQGRGALRLPAPAIQTDDATMVTLDLEGTARRGRLLLFAATTGGDEPKSVAVLDALPQAPVTLFLGNAAGWQGQLEALLLGLEGPGNALVTVRRVQVSSPTFAGVLAGLLQTRARPGPWSARSINIALESAGHELAAPWIAATWIALAAAVIAPVVAFVVYRVRGAAFPRAVPYPAIIGGVFLSCWVALDLVWLDHQRSTTNDAIERFASRPPETRPLAAEDAGFVLIGKRVDAAIDDDAAARIFVASADDYIGMRVAYQLYPRNVFWDRDAELPSPQWLRAGDYVLLLTPTAHELREDMLRFPLAPGAERRVARVFEAPGAVFLRVL